MPAPACPASCVGRVKHYKLLPMIFLFVGIGAVVALALSAATMTSLQFEIILFLIGVGFGPTAPLTQVVLQNTVSIHHLGAAIGTMNFVRTLLARSWSRYSAPSCSPRCRSGRRAAR